MLELVGLLGNTVNLAVAGVGCLLLVALVGTSVKILGLKKQIKTQEANAGSAESPTEVDNSEITKSTGHTKPLVGDSPEAVAAAASLANPEATAPPPMEPAALASSKPAPADPGDPDEPAEVDPSMVTQYQAGTGEGIEELEAQLEEDPENGDILDWLAFMYYSNGKLEEAISTYQRAIALAYENEHQHYYLANSFYKLGHRERAIEEWEVVISLKPEGKLAKNAEERITKTQQEQGS